MGTETLQLTTYKVLLVDDHAFTRMGLKFSLDKFTTSLTLLEAENGQQAIEIADKNDPDIILMDISMPIKDGIEATQEIKSKFPKIKIIILTSHQVPQQIHAALSAGADAY